MAGNFSFNDVSISKKLYFTVGLMAVLIGIELLTLFFSIHTLSSVRAYVEGEGLWSKAQKDAVAELNEYVRDQDERHYQNFLGFMKVPIGDSKARKELAKAEPDFEVARQGFLEGRNHPEDIDGMIQLFRRFHWISYISNAIYYWNKAEETVLPLIPLADSLHQEIRSAAPSALRMARLQGEIAQVNQSLTQWEDGFSYTLGEGSRWLERLVLRLLFVIALTVELTGLLLAISVSRGIQKGLAEIIEAARNFASGNLKARAKVFSKDEIGELAESFNQMSGRLEQNIAQQQQSELRLSKYAHDLELKNKELEQFAYVSSHDLQEPLRTVTSYVELLTRYPQNLSSEDRELYMRYISESAYRMKNQIKALLDYSRIGTNRELERVDCNELLAEVLVDLDTAIQESRAVIAYRNLPIVSGYRFELKSLFQNLISNAIKFQRPGFSPVVKVTGRADGTFWYFEVEDNGIGIEAKYMHKLFVIFQRLHSRSAYPGSGIGLAHCKKIVELHDGEIGVRSTFGMGCIFYFSLSKLSK
ncbi:MAG: ATP-binding protein [Chitinophagales bacterium]